MLRRWVNTVSSQLTAESHYITNKIGLHFSTTVIKSLHEITRSDVERGLTCVMYVSLKAGHAGTSSTVFRKTVQVSGDFFPRAYFTSEM